MLPTDSAPLSDLTRAMLLIKSIDPNAHLELSEFTHGWYVSAGIRQCNGSIEAGITEHRDTPEQAVAAFLDRLCTVPIRESLRTGSSHGRLRHWRWNGAAFVEEHFAHG